MSYVIVIFAWSLGLMRFEYVLKVFGGSVILLVVVYGTLYYRWRHLWAFEEIHQPYQVQSHHDDTLRVVMIGDSWAGMHDEAGLDSFLQRQLNGLTDSPVIVKSRGRGGEKTRGIYNLMFEYGKYGTRPILSERPDYCIVMAGINDAASNRGVRQYLYHYKLILDYLLSHNIRPVIVEIPMLKEEDMMNEIVLIPMKEWNEKGEAINECLFLEDQIHLNRRGYELLDSCIAFKIVEDYKIR